MPYVIFYYFQWINTVQATVHGQFAVYRLNRRGNFYRTV